MKRKYFFICSLILLFFFITIIYIKNNTNSNDIVKSTIKSNYKSNFLAVMVEQEDGSYEAKEENPNDWITSGYIFNKTLSRCENGGKISWDNENKKVIVEATSADKCYVYFSFPPSDVTVAVKNRPVNGYLPRATVTMTNGTATYNAKYNEILISSITGESKITLTYNEPATKDYLREKVEGLAATTSSRTDWQVVHETFVNASSVTIDTGYRYEGKKPDNYIWFNNELWRIIGSVPVLQSDGTTITNLVKIIRNDSIGGLTWNKNGKNEWADSSGNAVASLNFLLNGAYLDWKINKANVNDYCYGDSKIIPTTCDYSETGIKDEYRGMIKEVTWQLGGHSTNEATPAIFYEAERGTGVCSTCTDWGTSFVGKIGLMYASDYGYSVLASSCPRNDTNKLSSYSKTSCAGSAWLYGQGYEWTLSPNSSNNSNMFNVYYIGNVGNFGTFNGYAIRPVLYLDSSVYVVDGTGTISDPYIIAK